MQNKQTPTLKRSSSSVKTHIAAIMVAGLVLGAMPAQASVATNLSKADNIQVRVDLRDLETPRGVSNVYSQLSKRAQQACKTSGHTTLIEKRVSKTCSADLLAEFVRDLDDDRITAYHRSANS